MIHSLNIPQFLTELLVGSEAGPSNEGSARRATYDRIGGMRWKN
jgi:hypothetical protein